MADMQKAAERSLRRSGPVTIKGRGEMNMRSRLCSGVSVVLAGLVLSFLYTHQALAIEDSVDWVSSSSIATSVVRIPGCSGVLIEPNWVLTIAHCADRWSDRTVPSNRDVTITRDRPEATFINGTTSVNVAMDRVVRVDGAATLTNSLALFHLTSAAPAWSKPVPLYRGEMPGKDESIEVFGYGGVDRTRRGGTVTIDRRDWRDTDKFWVLRMEADPSSIEAGDSGGPLFVTRSGEKFILGVNWNSGGASGGSAAAALDIDSEGHWNPVGSLVERTIRPGATIRDGVYEVKAAHSDKWLDVPHSSLEDSANIIQFSCTNATNQQWRFVRKSGYYEISAVHSGKCLDVPRSSQANVELIQYGCFNTANQRWRLTEVAGGAYVIQAQHSAKCLDVPRSSVANEVKVIQFKCTRATNQRWKLTYKRE